MSIIERTKSILSDTRYFLVELSDSTYSMPIPLLSNASIGQHTRHLLEFYQCLISQMAGEEINYDKRMRKKEIEEETASAIDAIHQIEKHLKDLPTEKALTIRGRATDGVPIKTNLEREILYNLEHSIHHLAIIKIGLKIVAPNLDIPENFGVAPSTIAYRNQT